MVLIQNNKKIFVDWTILKASSTEKENFSRADVFVFLLSCNGRSYYSATASNGVISVELPETLDDGVYGLKAVWVKENDLGKKVMTQISELFTVGDLDEETDNACHIKVTSHVATYGYDGLDAYEMAVMRGKTTLNEEEWVYSASDMNDKYSSIASDYASKKAYIEATLVPDTNSAKVAANTAATNANTASSKVEEFLNGKETSSTSLTKTSYVITNGKLALDDDPEAEYVFGPFTTKKAYERVDVVVTGAYAYNGTIGYNIYELPNGLQGGKTANLVTPYVDENNNVRIVEPNKTYIIKPIYPDEVPVMESVVVTFYNDGAYETERSFAENEATRNNNEEVRISNENARKSAEGTVSSYGDGTRIGEENVRRSQETARQNSEAERQSNETVRQTQESNRQNIFSRNEGTSASPSTENSRWGNYKASEASRNTQYSQAEGERDSQYSQAESNRNSQYGTAEGQRNSTTTTELNRIKQQYASAEGSRLGSESGDGSRWGVYKTEEASRNTRYSQAESNRNSQYANAEGTSSSTGGDGSRWGAYKTAEAQRSTDVNALKAKTSLISKESTEEEDIQKIEVLNNNEEPVVSVTENLVVVKDLQVGDKNILFELESKLDGTDKDELEDAINEKASFDVVERISEKVIATEEKMSAFDNIEKQTAEDENSEFRITGGTNDTEIIVSITEEKTFIKGLSKEVTNVKNI